MSDYGSTPPPPPPGGGSNPPPPSYGYQGAPGPQGMAPPNYLVWAILSTIFCCWPVGIASIVFASQVNSKWAAGDVVGAQAASDKAKKFAIWTVIAGVIWDIGTVIFVIAVGGISTNFNTGTSGF